MIQIHNTNNQEYYSKLIERIVKELRIKTLVNDPLKEIAVFFSRKKSKSLGTCLGTRDHVKISIFVEEHKKMYKTKKVYDKEILDTLIHEFVHAKQFMKGELVAMPGYYKYMSKKYLPTQPWEDEAYEKSKKVAKKIK